MEFLTGNYLDTTSMLSIDSGTLTQTNLYNPDKTKQWVSVGQNDDSVTSVITISFSQTTTIDRIAIKEHNLKEFKAYYNGDTTSVFALASGDTATLSYVSNSETSQFFNLTPVDCTSVSLYMTKTQQVDSEKAVGFLYVGEKLLDLPRIPAANNYKINKRVVKIEHKLSDGGVRLQKISEKWESQVKLNNISQSDVVNLEEIYNSRSNMCFSPFGTSTSWNGILFDCVWTGDFGFWEYADNAVNAGFEGTIRLTETPW